MNSLAEEVADLGAQLERKPRLFRLLVAVYLVAIGATCLWGGHAIIQLGHWIAWAFALLLLEPLGVTLVVAGLFAASPSMGVQRWFVRSLPRAKLGLTLLLIAFLAFVYGTLIWGLFELWRTYRT